MPLIQKLSPEQIKKIAAGEVIERPSNVLKELIENALDAYATQITIYIQQAGKQLIRVIDNGIGMSNQDAHLCFEHHATSKITTVEQLQEISTFGFRGEALSSIAAVTKVTLITKKNLDPLATKLVFEDNVLIKEQMVTANTGTDIAVADLFYNIPARKKFLKTNETEWRQILLLFQSFCLNHPGIHFTLYSNDALQFNCPAVEKKIDRIAQLWDYTVAKQILPLEYQNNGIAIDGIISNHSYFRYDRSSIFFFVNQRWVKNHILSRALLKGYSNVLPADKYPLAALSIEINQTEIDINIHPRKEEIQFQHPGRVEAAIQMIVKEILQDNLAKQFQKNSLPFQGATTYTYQPRKIFSTIGFQLEEPASIATTYDMFDQEVTSVSPSVIDSFKSMQIISENDRLPLVGFTDYQIIGQFKKTYILIEQPEGLFLIDQHAAHERILYEQFSKRFESMAMIQLIFPQIIMLSSADHSLLEQHLEIFKTNNIQVELFGQNQIIIQAVPSHLKEISFEELIKQTIGWIQEFHKLDKDLFYKKINEKLHAQMACKGAIKAGDFLTVEQMTKLLHDLAITENRFTCPHGRPTGWSLSLYEIEKRFKRKI